MSYTAKAYFDTSGEELYSFLEQFGSQEYKISGDTIDAGLHPANKERLLEGKNLEMDLDEAYRHLKDSPRTSYRVSLTYEDNVQINISARVGVFPSINISTELETFDHFEEFSEFLADEDIEWK